MLWLFSRTPLRPTSRPHAPHHLYINLSLGASTLTHHGVLSGSEVSASFRFLFAEITPSNQVLGRLECPSTKDEGASQLEY